MDMYSGENNYLIPCWFCKFAHFIIFMVGLFELIETEHQTNQKNPEKSSIQMLKIIYILVSQISIWSPTNQQEFWLPHIDYVHMWNTD